MNGRNGGNDGLRRPASEAEPSRYEPPRLVSYGDVADSTHGKGTSHFESGNCKNTGRKTHQKCD